MSSEEAVSSPHDDKNAQPPPEKPKFQQCDVGILDDAHRETLARAITRVLSTELAEVTFAQLIDGLPTADVAFDHLDNVHRHRDHPIYLHKDLCPGVLEKTREFRSAFNVGMLKFDSRILLAYKAASSGSRAFKMRLIELVAVSVHQIAVILFQMDSGLHKDDGIAEWEPPDADNPQSVYRVYNPNGPPPFFRHMWYTDHEQYPNGLADVAGYWAENRILGGVVLFDRRPDGDADAVYTHPGRRCETYRICKLLPEQKQGFLDFLLSEEPPLSHEPTGGPDSPGPDPKKLPIRTSQENLDRVDPEDPIAETGIYRDAWERKEREVDDGDERMRDVWDKHDFPTWADWQAAGERARLRQNKQRGLDAEGNYIGIDSDGPAGAS